MSATLPVTLIRASPVPSPVMKVNPLMPARVRVPLAADRATLTWAPPTSTSPMLIRLPPAHEKVSGVSSAVVWAPGTVLTGASLTDVIVMSRTSVLLPASPSWTVKLTVRAAGLGFSLVFA